MTATASHERAYRALLRLYPAQFRARYGDEMAILYRDLMRDARRRGGPGTALATWLRAVGDTLGSSVSERLSGDPPVGKSLGPEPPRFGRILAALGIVGGLVLVAAFVPSLAWPEGWFPARVALFNAGAIAIVVASARRYPDLLRRPLARAAVVAAIAANAAYLAMVILSIGRPVFPEPDPEFRTVFLWIGVAMWWADVAFGIAAIRLPGLARLGALALAVGSVGAFSGMGHLQLLEGDLGWLFGPVSQVGIALNGLGWIALGIALARRGPTVTAGPEPVRTAVSEPGVSATPPR